MSFTRFNYDDCRTQKILEESTGPGDTCLTSPVGGINLVFLKILKSECKDGVQI